MAINLGGFPYYDRFKPSNNWMQLLFQPDRPLQQAELNELQSIIRYQLGAMGDSFFKDGNMITGMDFTKDNNNILTVNPGTLYLDGQIRNFKQQSIQITGQGREEIGVKVEQSIITADEDDSLLDPTQGVPSQFSRGADRLVENVVLTLNDEAAPTIYRFDDGNLFVNPDKPDYAIFNDVLAERTYDESGNYRVSGFQLWTEPGSTADTLNLVVDSGRAYVLGYKVDKPTSTRIPIDKSLETRNVVRETHTYSADTQEILVGSSSVNKINQVIARSVTPDGGVIMSKGIADGRDKVPDEYTNIDRNTPKVWTQVSAADPTHTHDYVYGTDYRIVEDNGIQYVDWNASLNGVEPPTGTSYYISFEYDRIMTEGVDYQVNSVPNENKAAGVQTYVDFNGMPGNKPKDNGIVQLSYSFYLARTDLIVLDSKGELTVIKGQPDIIDYLQAPVQSDPLTLQIGTVTLYPNSDYTITNSYAVTRLRFEDLQKMKKRIEDLEYNQALVQLEDGAMATENPLLLRGVFADAFISLERYDANLSSVAFSFEDGEITLQSRVPDNYLKTPEILENMSEAYVWGRLVSAPFTENAEISQPLATEAMNVNPYNVFNKQGVLTLTPSVDNWIEQEKVTVIQDEAETYTVNRWWRHNGEVRNDDTRYIKSIADQIQLDEGQDPFSGGTGSNKRTGTIISSGGSQSYESMIEYIRQRDVEFKVSNLLPNSNNLYLTFDGVQVPMTPTGTTSAGSQSGTIRANAKGEATGKFTIPAGIRTGVREVTLRNNDNMAISTYTAQGTKKTTEDIIIRTRVTVNLYDPLAQSFVFPTDRVVTSIGLYFASKSSTDNVIVQIRGLSEGGLPNRTIYAETILTPEAITISEDGTAETRVYFDDPLMATAGQNYCIVLITDSSQYTMWIATRGQTTVGSNPQTVTSNPYLNGVLFSSSNAVTWTPHQDSDLKFNVYTATFQENAVIEFDTMEEVDADKVMIMATYLTPQNTGCLWDVKIVPQSQVGLVSIDSVPWQPLPNYLDVTTNEVAGLIKLRATFTSNRYISPLLSLEDLTLVNFVTETTGDYVSRTSDFSEAPFNNIKLGYEAFLPAGANVKPYYSLDQGTTWNEFTSTPSTTRLSSEFVRFSYNEQVSEAATNTSFKIRLSLSGENRFTRPRVRKLTCVVKDEITGQ